MAGSSKRNAILRLRTVLVAALIAAPVVLVPPTVASAATPTELYFSEYIEGTSFNKAVEIYNGTGATVDLGGGYNVQIFFNGNTTPNTTINLTGSVADGDVHVLADDGAAAAILAVAEQTAPNSFFNGDDAVVLRKGTTIVDVIGQVGFDPGSQWGSGDTSTQNNTIRRLAAVCAGDPVGSDAFDPATEWNGFAQNTFDGLGSHVAACADGPDALVINEVDYDQPGSDAAEYLEIYNPSGAAVSLDGLSVELVNGSGGGAVLYNTIALPNVSLAAGDYYVVCANAATVANCDLDASPNTNFLQNGAPDAVGLRNGGGLIDAVSYEGSVPGYTEGSGAGLSDPGADGSISRCANGADTDQNNIDFANGRASTPGTENHCPGDPPPFGECADAATFIHEVQGNGFSSPIEGELVNIEGVVVGDFEASSELNGFFVQEEDADADADAETSEGIFIAANGFGLGVAVGDVVRVAGTVDEFFGLTRLESLTNLAICSAGASVSPSEMNLPVSGNLTWEASEGMSVEFSQTLFASGNFTQARFGEVDLSVGGALDNPTNVVAPGAPAIALQELNNRSRIQLDDGSNVQNPLPLPPYLGAGNTLRTGDSVAGLTGVMSFAFGAYEVHPTTAVDFTRANTRPGVPDVGGTIQVAAYNVLNYFTTIDNAGPICGPLGDQGCRGADTASEFTRQRDKLVTAISTLDADVVGLMEIENNAGDVPTADLVAGLNAATAPGTYDFIATGAVGTDAIRQAILYQPAAVTPLGDFDVLDSNDDPTFDDERNRPMVSQTFVENATGAVFTVAVNHLKSKGSNCDEVFDPDANDGQGNCNLTRMAAAQAIVDHLATDPTGSGDSDFLIVGDLNAYAMEDPVTTIEADGYTDLIEAFVGTGYSAGAYSFNFFSQSGYLDHGLANPSMASQVSGAAFWHVNTDEPSGLDYNNFNQPGLYNPDQFRSSDHDPVVIGLMLDTPMDLKEAARDDLAAALPTGDANDDKFIGKAITRIDQSLNPDWWTGPATLDLEDGRHVFDREHQAVVELEKVGDPVAQAAIDDLLEADRGLALTQLLIAIAGGGDAADIAKAQDNLADAAANIAAGNSAQAILDYKKAWMNAVKAL